MRLPVIITILAIALAGGTAHAGDPVNIDKKRAHVEVPTGDGMARIERNQDPQNRLEGDWALTSRACPPFCIQPMNPAEGVATIGELELLDLLADPKAVVLDSRTRSWFEGGTIPGAINLPYTEIADRLDELGCEIDFDGWICGGDVPSVALFCNGPWCGQSPEAIRRMIEAGYPADKIHYYRGGMQVWRLLGLSVTDPQS